MLPWAFWIIPYETDSPRPIPLSGALVVKKGSNKFGRPSSPSLWIEDECSATLASGSTAQNRFNGGDTKWFHHQGTACTLEKYTGSITDHARSSEHQMLR